MQSVFPLSWSTEHHSFEKIRPSSLFDMAGVINPKRKRSESVEHQVKKIRTNVENTPHVDPQMHETLPAKLPQKLTSETPILKAPIPPIRRPEPEARPVAAELHAPAQEDEILTGGLTPSQQIIENEFNVQILMKHNELRLIEQELAKCQISLEQLRRCELRPFPGAVGLSTAVTEGTSPAIAPPPGFSRPSHPTPYGVLDGPYSRHYKQWLLPDPQFDSISLQAQMAGSSRDGTRTSRTQSHAPRKSTSKANSGSHQRVDSFNSMPNHAAASNKDKTTPLVLRRSTDGQLVKLICKNCHRGNFSSIQGFLNHCRIAHKVDYKSHDQAAVDCGKLLDQNEVASLPAETQATPMPKPSSTRHSSSNTSVVRASNFVHQFNTTAGMPAAAPRQVPRTPAIPGAQVNTGAPNSFNAEPFKASSETPRLSAHFAKHKLGGNLAQATALAKQKVEPSIEDDMQSPGISDAGSPVASFTGTRMPANVSQQQQNLSDDEPANWNIRKIQSLKDRPRPSPLAPLAPAQRDLHNDYLSSPQELSSASLSPHTVDGNPGLVSDHEDDDHGSASEDEEETPQALPQSLPQAASHCAENMEVDVEEGEGFERGVIIRRNSMLAAQAGTIRASGSPSRKLGGIKGEN